MTLRRLSFFCLLYALLSACSSIPTLTFMDLDAEADGSLDSSLDDGAVDAEASADADGGMPDGADGCPNVIPPGIVACCGAIPCGNANCGLTACTDCENKCATSALCCPNAAGKATCLLDAALCP